MEDRHTQLAGTTQHHEDIRLQAVNTFIQAACRLKELGLDVCLAVVAPKRVQFWSSDGWRSGISHILRDASNLQAGLNKENRNAEMFVKIPQELDDSKQLETNNNSSGDEAVKYWDKTLDSGGFRITSPPSHIDVVVFSHESLNSQSPEPFRDEDGRTEEPESEKNTIVCEEMDLDRPTGMDVEGIIKLHSRRDGQTLQCRLCSFSSNKSTILVNHAIAIHRVGIPYRCEYCDYKTCQPKTLIRHIMRHTGEAFCCYYCDYETLRKDHLRTHLRRHTGDYPHACKYCGYKTPRKDHLSRHLLRHTGHHQCYLCPFNAAERGYIIKHLVRHVNEAPFLCKLCDFRTDRVHSFHAHMKKHTGETIEDAILLTVQAEVNKVE